MFSNQTNVEATSHVPLPCKKNPMNQTPLVQLAAFIGFVLVWFDLHSFSSTLGPIYHGKLPHVLHL